MLWGASVTFSLPISILILFKRSIKIFWKVTALPHVITRTKLSLNRRNRTCCFTLVSTNAINITHAESTGMQRPLYLIQLGSRPFCGGGRVKPVSYWEQWFWNNKHPIRPNSFWAKWEALFISGIVPWGHLIPSREALCTGVNAPKRHQGHVGSWPPKPHSGMERDA